MYISYKGYKNTLLPIIIEPPNIQCTKSQLNKKPCV